MEAVVLAALLGGITLNNTGGTLNRTTKASNINNDSAIVGTTVKDALETLNGTVLNAITSTAGGDWKKITSIEYNPISGEIRVSYEA